ncbi:MAG: T9SS type A sorting domain-containing protein [Saprospiraceae bacterium]
MKKLLPLLIVALFAINTYAQTCVRDSSILMTGALLSPAYWDTITMEYNLNDACILNPYTQSVTVNVPAQYSGFPLTSVQIATSGAVTNLPVGITYLCDPPNCVFNANTLGCILLYGTPTAANNTPDTLDLGITTTVNTQIGGIPIKFPGDLPGDNHYYLAVKDQQCLVGTQSPNADISYVSIAPNPFANETTITVESVVSGDFQFEVFNVIGQRVHQRNIRLDTGINQFTFDGSRLPLGSYIYTLSNRSGKVSRRMVISR